MIALGIDSGLISVSFWAQNPTKSAARGFQSLKKVIEELGEFGIDFLSLFASILASNFGGPGGPTNQGFGVKSAPGATLGPKWHPSPIQTLFFVDLGRFLVDFGQMLGRRWVAFGPIFNRF